MTRFNAFEQEPIELQEAELEAAARVIRSGRWILGDEVRSFEERWASICGTAHAVGVGNGMDAIEIILRSLDVGPGDEVITTPMTAVATVLAIIRAGATPVLADIDPETALLSRESVERCLSPRTRAIVLVHLYGYLRDGQMWRDFCSDKGVYLVEDAAQAHLAAQDGLHAGKFGVAAAYSFYPTKNLGAVGDAGMIVTDDEGVTARARTIRNYGQTDRYVHDEVGLNSRLDELQAAILSARLQWLEVFTNRRREIADYYRRGISSDAVTQLETPLTAAQHVNHLYVIRADDRQALQGHLATHDVETLIHYPIPVHRQRPFVDLPQDPIGLGAAESHAATCLSLPVHPMMTDQQASTVVDVVNGFPTASDTTTRAS